MTENRRLAAILAADVVGYSRLMQEDEAGTLAALKQRRREIFEPTLARHRGRVVKLMGDGVLVEFGSAVAAVQCAVELQQAMSAAGSSNDANDQKRKTILLRIGVNLGDVICRGLGPLRRRGKYRGTPRGVGGTGKHLHICQGSR
jgi:class 3 adenylate cyclase